MFLSPANEESALLLVNNMSEQRKAVIKNADMSDSMQQDAVDVASKALTEYNIEKVGAAARAAGSLHGHYTLESAGF